MEHFFLYVHMVTTHNFQLGKPDILIKMNVGAKEQTLTIYFQAVVTLGASPGEKFTNSHLKP